MAKLIKWCRSRHSRFPFYAFLGFHFLLSLNCPFPIDKEVKVHAFLRHQCTHSLLALADHWAASVEPSGLKFLANKVTAAANEGGESILPFCFHHPFIRPVQSWIQLIPASGLLTLVRLALTVSDFSGESMKYYMDWRRANDMLNTQWHTLCRVWFHLLISPSDVWLHGAGADRYYISPLKRENVLSPLDVSAVETFS